VSADRLTKGQIRRLALALRDLTALLGKADAKLGAGVYAELMVNVVHDHERRVVSVTAGPSLCTEGVGEAYDPASRPALLRGEVLVRVA
jgi:hypothetical protein